MNYKLPHENKMRNYLNQFSTGKITETEWENCIDNLVSFAEYIEEERDGEPFIQEVASTEIDIGDDSYEVRVKYNTVYEHGVKTTLIDFDYEYPFGYIN